MRAAQEAQEAEDNRLIEGEEEEEEEGGESAKVLRFTGPGRILQKSSASGFAEKFFWLCKVLCFSGTEFCFWLCRGSFRRTATPG